jgi:hypothetical protein
MMYLLSPPHYSKKNSKISYNKEKHLNINNLKIYN